MANYQSQYKGAQADEAIGIALDVLNRLKGNSDNHNNYGDPVLWKDFTGGEGAYEEAKTWLASQHGVSGGLNHVGLIRMNINGSSVWVINNVHNFAQDIWTQTLLNANIDVNNGNIYSGTNMYVRECSNGVWGDWDRFVKASDISRLFNVTV